MSGKQEITKEEEDFMFKLVSGSIGNFSRLDNPDLIGKVTSYLDPTSVSNWKKTGKSMKQLIESTKNFETANVGIYSKYKARAEFFYKANLTKDFFKFMVTVKKQLKEDVKKFINSFGNKNDRLVLNLSMPSIFKFRSTSKENFNYQVLERIDHKKSKTEKPDSIRIDSNLNLYSITLIRNGIKIQVPPQGLNASNLSLIYDKNSDTITLNMNLDIEIDFDSEEYETLSIPLFKLSSSQWIDALSNLLYIPY
jgi:hypothetical protein